jgi:hypothetical protein
MSDSLFFVLNTIANEGEATMLNHRTTSKNVTFKNSHGETLTVKVPPPSKQLVKAMNDYNNRLVSAFNSSYPINLSSETNSKPSKRNVKTKKK